MARKLNKSHRLETMADLADAAIQLFEDGRDGLRDTADAARLASILKAAADLKMAGNLEAEVVTLQRRLKAKE
jgi:hypothetical protein